MLCEESSKLTRTDQRSNSYEMELSDVRDSLTLLAELNAQHYGVDLRKFWL